MSGSCVAALMASFNSHPSFCSILSASKYNSTATACFPSSFPLTIVSENHEDRLHRARVQYRTFAKFDKFQGEAPQENLQETEPSTVDLQQQQQQQIFEEGHDGEDDRFNFVILF